MVKLFRVARDSSAAIFQFSDDSYVAVDRDSAVLSRGTLVDVSKGRTWRKAVTDDPAQSLFSVKIPKERRKRLPQGALTVLTTLDSSGFLDGIGRSVLEAGGATDDEVRHLSVYSNGLSDILTSDDYRTLQDWCGKNSLTVDAYTPSSELTYFGVGDTLGEITGLVALDGTSLAEWDSVVGEFVPIEDTLETFDREYIVELDEDEILPALSGIIRGGSYLLAPNPDDWDEYEDYLASGLDESELFALAADATGYSALERSVNAKRQRRGPDGSWLPEPRVKGGLTSKPRTNRSKKLSRYHRARLKFILPRILDPDTTIQEWIAKNPALWNMKSERYDFDRPLTAAGGEGLNALYFAIVDYNDHESVLDVIAIQGDGAGEPLVWRRSGGEWVSAQEILDEIRSTTPPAVVQLEDEAQVKDVLEQIDTYDRENPDQVADEESEGESSGSPSDLELSLEEGTDAALPDGSFLILDRDGLVTAIESYTFSEADYVPEDAVKIKEHITRRAEELGLTDLLPEDWFESETESTLAEELGIVGEYGEAHNLATLAPGIPGDSQNLTLLKNYWKVGPGAEKVRWKTPGDLDRATLSLARYLPTGHAITLASAMLREVYR